MMTLILTLAFFAMMLLSLANSYKAIYWQAASIAFIAIASFAGMATWGLIVCLIPLLLGMTFFHLPQVKSFISNRIYSQMQSSIPKLSSTEEEALNAGNTWMEESIFRGNIDWDKLYSIPQHTLTEEEQHFLENETCQLLSMCDEWKINQNKDLPPEIWQFLKDKGFFGLVIGKEFGGHGFSAKAHSDIVMKIASKSCLTAVTVMVPNSLGPGELISHYGTDEQKQKYLPALANGSEIPCFALTEPTAGSDATSIFAEAVVEQREVNGQMELGMSVTFSKRWITLAPVATLIGLAVNVKDPQGLLSEGQEGITCLLLPRKTPGLEIGNRHIPANQYFMNGTIRGKDIFVPIDSIIGGMANAGKGWRMLVECLSIGRSISLPALGTTQCYASYIAASAYGKIRRQFNLEIGKFEGIEEKLAEIAGLSYLTAATRQLTVAAVDEGMKPSVASAIAKYFNTEHGRKAVINAMDILGGKAVVNGPSNFLINAYQAAPISITVEGANIMTRNLLLFGQGAMACHPFVRDEFYALSQGNQANFSSLLWQHVNYFLKNLSNTILSGFTGGYLLKSPKPFMKREHQQLTRLSHAFAWVGDLCLMVLGGDLKRKERLSARLGDALSHLYMAAAVLKTCNGNDNKAEQTHAKWALQYCFYQAQKALLDLARNFPNRPVGWLIRLLAFPLGQTMKAPSDKLDHALASLTMTNQAFREQIRKRCYLTNEENTPMGKMDEAFHLILDNEALYKQVEGIGKVSIHELDAFLSDKVKQGKLTEEQKQSLLRSETARWETIQVDEFPFDAFTTDNLMPSKKEAVESI